MKKEHISVFAVLSAMLMFVPVTSISVFAQQEYRLNDLNSTLVINGSSNLHNWSEKVQNMNCTAVFNLNNSAITEIKKVSFTCKVKDIQSDKSLMEKKTYSALKQEEYPEITFQSEKLVRLNMENNGNFNGVITGNLTIAGKTRQDTISFEGRIVDEGNINVRGSVRISMSDFGIEPPTYLFGALKTDNDVTVDYNFNFVKY